MIRIEKLNKYYNRHKKNEIHVIDNTTLTLPDKGIVALLGPSGCGKTTLLNSIGGLDKVNSGNIYINDKKLTTKLTYKKDKLRNLKVGYIFQDYKLIDNMTVYDNVSLALKMIGIKEKKEIKKRVEYILDRIGMYRYRNRPCGMLSGGERQRAGIARALVKNPDIILADEPTGNLDSKNTIEVMNIIKSISKDKLVILVTHEVELASFYADRIIEVLDGKVVKDYENKDASLLDYRLDNKFYLKDFTYHDDINVTDNNIDIYSDKKEKLNLTIVFKNGNIYIKNKGNEKIEIIDNNSTVELVNDHYKKLDKSIYEKYSFDFDKIINKDINLKYSSIFNIFTIFTNGFKKVFDYSLAKKLLLIGFFLSSLFVTYSVCNLLGVNKIEDKDFVITNKDYLLLRGNKIKINDYLDYEKIPEINYIMPGNSIVSLRVDNSNYYQTEKEGIAIRGSLSSVNMLKEEDLIYGRLPQEANEIVIDKMVYDNTRHIEMYGLYNIEKMLDHYVYLGNRILNYKIVGITDISVPNIYMYESEFINVIDNSFEGSYWYGGFDENADDRIKSYELYKDKLKVTKGRSPVNDYEVVVNENLKETYKLNKVIDDLKVNNTKLKVVGYYTSPDNLLDYYVSDNTIKYKVIEKKANVIIYPSDKEEVINNFKSMKRTVIDIYQKDKDSYLDANRKRISSSITVALVMLAISLIEIILMTRSSFLSRIKEVGTLRAIGVKKSDIYKMFMGEAFAITTLTQIPGVLFMSYCISVLSSVRYVASNYVVNINVVILCIVMLYVFNIVVGLIPVFNTIRKTPASILARTDVE